MANPPTATELWKKYTTQGGRPEPEERMILLQAYWSSTLPKPGDLNPYQWVEDRFPSLK